ncbi:hypothetical protein EIN_151330 [Entamoeba invadens IP1]|uniref:UBA domain-containing protein n=1 Tax=Entamoeba invadens IP1 TaxID=370355 RepID=A0A0A1UEI4_ENTIV|nr:hypothetical protein EIN_151330 [Entamoeba invadens IP1]ELP91236.1 hypothetical protein EIN_151330 [Entamoeba invadens IP1]|eukprot:XP_004258007.1 hypothetical protein EIN_151330 [Entamoeba invadens IP1]
MEIEYILVSGSKRGKVIFPSLSTESSIVATICSTLGIDPNRYCFYHNAQEVVNTCLTKFENTNNSPIIILTKGKKGEFIQEQEEQKMEEEENTQTKEVPVDSAMSYKDLEALFTFGAELIPVKQSQFNSFLTFLMNHNQTVIDDDEPEEENTEESIEEKTNEDFRMTEMLSTPFNLFEELSEVEKSKMAVMKMLGFTNDKEIITAIRSADGDIDIAVGLMKGRQNK